MTLLWRRDRRFGEIYSHFLCEMPLWAETNEEGHDG